MKISKEIREEILKATSAGEAIEILRTVLPEGTKISLADIDNIGGDAASHILKFIEAEDKERRGKYMRGFSESYQAERES